MYKILANTEFIGKKIFYLPHCHSTNVEAQKLAANQSAKNGDIVITDSQSEGRGTGSNIWISEAYQNITQSVIFYPEKLKASDHFNLNICTTLAVIKTCEDYGIKAKIKWPNDILIERKKISGILINNTIRGSRISEAIIGIGLNVNQENFAFNACSLKNITGRTYHLNNIFNTLCLNLDNYLSTIHEMVSLKKLYLKYLFGLEEKWTYIDNRKSESFRGIIKGIDEKGKLIIDDGLSLRKFNFKEVTFPLS